MDIGQVAEALHAAPSGPLVGQKYMFIELVANDALQLRSGILKRAVGKLGVARCDLKAEHLKGCPIKMCRCGFYAFQGASGAIQYDGNLARALATVKLTGRVIQHEKGYRAQYQRVLSLEFQRFCKICGTQADRLSVMSDPRNSLLYPVCEHDALQGSVSLEEASRRLRIPVQWTYIR